MESLDPWALTVTFERPDKRGAQTHFKYVLRPVGRLLNQSCSDWRLYPELTIQGNLHFHCVIYVKDKIKFYKNTLPKLKDYGFVCVKKIDDLIGWETYCQKDAQFMRAYLETFKSLPISKAIFDFENDIQIGKSKVAQSEIDFFSDLGGFQPPIITENNHISAQRHDPEPE